MKQVQAFLLENDGAAARRRLATLLEHHPDKVAQAGAAAAAMVQQAYQQFHVQAVHDFCDGIEKELPAIVCEAVGAALGAAPERTRHWDGVLRGVTEERLVRDAKARLTHKDLKGSAALGHRLLARARDDEEARRLAIGLGRGLAGMRADQTQARAVVEAIVKKVGNDAPGAAALATAYLNAAGERGPSSYERAGRADAQQLTEALLSLRSALPRPNEAGEPAPEQLAQFRDEAHAVLRAALWRERPEELIDAIAILVEYCPADPSTVKNVAGVEDRMFLQLGPRARLTAVRGFAQLGELEPLRRAVSGLADSNPDGQASLKLLAGIMGGLRNADFYPFLSKALTRTDSEMEEGWIVDALGRIASPDAVGLLLDRLGDSVKRRLDPAFERRALVLMTALGRIGRSPANTPQARNAMVGKVVQIVDGTERILMFRAALELFSVRLGEIDPRLKAWAARQAVEAMWGQPPAGPGGRGGTWREPMMAVLRWLGAESLPAVLDAAEKFTARYSGAMGALAEVLADVGDARAVPLLETMIRVAIMHREDPHRSRLMDEKVLDAETGEERDLDRDDLVHTLLYATMKIGGPAGLEVVLDYADQIQAGRLESPGGKTSGLLVDAKVKHGRLDEVSRRAEAIEVSEKDLKQKMSEARGGLLAKKATRIGAIAVLGSWRQPEATPVLLEALGDKDPMISGAAHTALAQYMHPLPVAEEFTAMLDALLEDPKLLKGRALESFLEFVRRELPKKAPYDRLFARQVEISVEDGELVHRIMAAARAPASAGAAPLGPEGGGEEPTPPSGAASGRAAAPPAAAKAAPRSALDERMEYMKARKAWLTGGKQGDPPAPPKGFQG